MSDPAEKDIYSKVHFVYDGVEVKKTGRIAEKQVQLPGGRCRVLQLIEITPAEDEDGWKKWVAPEVLFEIVVDDDK